MSPGKTGSAAKSNQNDFGEMFVIKFDFYLARDGYRWINENFSADPTFYGDLCNWSFPFGYFVLMLIDFG